MHCVACSSRAYMIENVRVCVCVYNGILCGKLCHYTQIHSVTECNTWCNHQYVMSYAFEMDSKCLGCGQISLHFKDSCHQKVIILICKWQRAIIIYGWFNSNDSITTTPTAATAIIESNLLRFPSISTWILNFNATK